MFNHDDYHARGALFDDCPWCQHDRVEKMAAEMDRRREIARTNINLDLHPSDGHDAPDRRRHEGAGSLILPAYPPQFPSSSLGPSEANLSDLLTTVTGVRW